LTCQAKGEIRIAGSTPVLPFSRMFGRIIKKRPILKACGGRNLRQNFSDIFSKMAGKGLNSKKMFDLLNIVCFLFFSTFSQFARFYLIC
jgi:hypothetical protein